MTQHTEEGQSAVAAQLVSRSNRLGADPRTTNYAGGNTSAKGVETLRWDILRIFQEVCAGLRAAARQVGDRGDVLAGVGVDSWAVDYGLLAVGASLKLAFKVAVAVEENAEVLFRASAAGKPNVLVYADIDVPEGARLP